MSEEEKEAMLDQLPRHTWPSVQRRLRELNGILSLVLSPHQRGMFSIGKIFVPDESMREVMYLRVLIAIGVAILARREGSVLRQKMPDIGRALVLHPEYLKNVKIPDSYATKTFRHIVSRGLKR
jgi:hypothetical protein